MYLLIVFSRFMMNVIDVYYEKLFVGPILFSISISLAIFAQIIVSRPFEEVLLLIR